MLVEGWPKVLDYQNDVYNLLKKKKKFGPRELGPDIFCELTNVDFFFNFFERKTQFSLN